LEHPPQRSSAQRTDHVHQRPSRRHPGRWESNLGLRGSQPKRRDIQIPSVRAVRDHAEHPVRRWRPWRQIVREAMHRSRRLSSGWGPPFKKTICLAGGQIHVRPRRL